MASDNSASLEKPDWNCECGFSQNSFFSIRCLKCEKYRPTPSSSPLETAMAKNMDEQCMIGKWFGRFGKAGGTYRCQLRKDHDGDHVDWFGRKWPRGNREIRKAKI